MIKNKNKRLRVSLQSTIRLNAVEISELEELLHDVKKNVISPLRAECDPAEPQTELAFQELNSALNNYRKCNRRLQILKRNQIELKSLFDLFK